MKQSISTIATERPFVTLDGLRGIAALTIITRHVGYFRSPFFESYLAVDFFFLLSGFVLSHAYGQRLRSHLSAGDFLKIRIIRLYPLYTLSLALSVAILALITLTGKHPTAHDPAMAIIFSALFLPTPAALSIATLFPLNGIAWSLFFEIVANTWWAAAWKRITTLRLAIFVGLMALLLLIAVLRRRAGFGFAPATGVMDNGWQWGSVAAGFIRVGFSFFCGILMHRAWTSTKAHLRLSPWVSILVLIVVLTANPPAAFQSYYDLIATLVVFPLIVWTGASAPTSGLKASVFSTLGVASYGVYVLQGPLIDIFRRANHVLYPTGLFNPFVGGAFVLFLFGITLITDRYYDRPVRDWLTRRLKRPATTVATS